MLRLRGGAMGCQAATGPRAGRFGPALTGASDCLHLYRTCARAVELAKIDALPRSEHQIAAFHKDRSGCADQAALDVRIAVALRVPETGYILWNVMIEPQEHVAHDIRVGV